MLNPASIIVPGKITESASFKFVPANQYERIAEIALTRAPNILKEDGRINCEDMYGEGVIAITVSPLNSKFRSQIEDDVWPLVKIFLEKNYITVSSCAGHDDGMGDGYHVILAIPSKEFAENIRKSILTIPNCNVYIFETIANVRQIFTDGNTYSHKIETKHDTKEKDLLEEYRDINYMYLRNYTEYVFLKITLFETGWEKIFSKDWFYTIKRKILFRYTKNKLEKLISGKDFPISPF
jgi:hypothetical protein